MIRSVYIDDADAICRIYNHYVIDTIVTFEEKPVSTEEMRGRIQEVTESLPWFVYELDGNVVGYAYSFRWKERSAYRFSVESSIYIDKGFVHKGIGKKLYEALILELRSLTLHCTVGSIALPNPVSVAFHEKMGFEKVAHFIEVGWKLNQWIDVGFWELIL